MKTIVAPTDFSDSSFNAVNYVADMAVDIKARPLLLQIVELPAITIAEFPVTDIPFQDVNREPELVQLKSELDKGVKNGIIIKTGQVPGSINYKLLLLIRAYGRKLYCYHGTANLILKTLVK